MKTKKLVSAAMLIALATILSVIPLLSMPFGGTVTLASMMPIVIISFLYGTKWGLFSAFVYSVMQLILGFGTVSAFFLPGDSQMALMSALMVCFIDYILAYTSLGFAGIFKNKVKSEICALLLGTLTACLLRYLMHIISGAVFFGLWSDWFFKDATGLSQISALKGFCKWTLAHFSGKSLSVFYSVIYNGVYMIPETIITLISSATVYKAISKKVNNKAQN